jgi:hypothetical protein
MIKSLIIFTILSFQVHANEFLELGCISTDSNWRVTQNLGDNRYEVTSIFGNNLSRYVVQLETIKVEKAGQFFPDWALQNAGFVELETKNGFKKKFKLYKESYKCAKLMAERNLDNAQYTLPKLSGEDYSKIKKEHEEYDRKQEEEYQKKQKAKEIKEVKKAKKQKKENKKLNELFE